ncbi:MAG: NAD(P)H-dependent glycerol-3-phosphate dehydrogenase [bacterium]
MKRLAIIGGGSWGTALAIVLAPRFPEVRLWVFEADLAERMAATRENDVFLPGFTLPGNVGIETELPCALTGADIVLSVTPSHVTRAVYERMRPHLSPSMLLVSATKGIENGTLMRMTEVIREATGAGPVAALSGPTFAREVARGEPTALVVASEDAALCRAVQVAFSGPSFRVYTNSDPVGVELAAALKNVIALGAGVCVGLGLGNNTMAALIARGLAEITRLAVAMGGQPLTLAGLAGLGDLVLTCTGELSRNRTVGFELGRGRSLDEITGSMRMIAEGVRTTYAAVELAARHGVEMPIAARVHAILSGRQTPQQAIRELMERSLKGE